jgi:hypothetical protein
MPVQKRGCYTVKTYTSELYTWCPDRSIYKAPQGGGKNNRFCNATPFSQGQDWISTYSYNVVVAQNGQVERLAYVECDYVQ